MGVDPASLTPFPRGRLLAAPPHAAAGLLGALLVRTGPDGARIGRIVEVEAYGGPEDRASHARSGRTSRNAPMFGAAGRAYVYRVYGMHLCLNIVTGPEGTASATLVRAVSPIEGLTAMRAARADAAVASRRVADPARDAATRARIGGEPAEAVASGPGRVAAAFGITLAMNGLDLCDPSSSLHLALPGAGGRGGEPGPSAGETVASARVGVAYAGPPWATLPWRFALARDLTGRSAVSRPRPASQEA